MSTAKYTPGPWEEVELFIVTPSDSVICKLSGWDAEHADEQAANARLIAAAPELLDAAYAALIDADAWLEQKNQDKSWAPALRTAIAKATGVQP